MGDPQNNQGDLKGILKEIVLRKIRKLHKSAERTGGNFNVFSILDRERKEVTTHSAIIAELLNPHGSHGQKTSFMKLFLGQLLEKLQKEQKAQKELRQLRENLEQIQEDELDKFRVEIETTKEGKVPGRIDILIESDGIKSGDVCIVIENKIDAEDQERQLGRYYEYALDTKKIPGIIYLTPEEGGKPTEKSLYGSEPYKMSCCGMLPRDIGVCPQTHRPSSCRMLPKDTVVCLSYEKFIDEWLDACIEKVAHIPQIKETLHQYQMTVRKLTEKPTEQLPPEVEDILNKDTLGENYKELKGEIIEDVQHALQCEFWKELKKRLIEEQLTDQNSKFQLYKSDMDMDVTEISEDDLEEYIGNNFLGLTFGIPNGLLDDGKHEVAFRVYYERPHGRTKLSSFNYGFVFCRKRNTEKDTLQRDRIKQQHKDEDAIKRCMRLEHPHEKDKPSHGQDGWLSWDYFYYKPRNFITESKETLIRRLTSEINLALSKAR